MKKATQKSIKNNTSSDQFTVVLEDINAKFSLVLEQFSGLNNKIDNNHREFLDFKKQTTENFAELLKFRNETTENFSVVKEYLSNLNKLLDFEKQLLAVEKILRAKMA